MLGRDLDQWHQHTDYWGHVGGFRGDVWPPGINFLFLH